MSRSKAIQKNVKKAALKKALPEVHFCVSALEYEFRRMLDPEASLEQVRDDYLDWVEEVEDLIYDYGPETTVAEIVMKMN